MQREAGQVDLDLLDAEFTELIATIDAQIKNLDGLRGSHYASY